MAIWRCSASVSNQRFGVTMTPCSEQLKSSLKTISLLRQINIIIGMMVSILRITVLAYQVCLKSNQTSYECKYSCCRLSLLMASTVGLLDIVYKNKCSVFLSCCYFYFFLVHYKTKLTIAIPAVRFLLQRVRITLTFYFFNHHGG